MGGAVTTDRVMATAVEAQRSGWGLPISMRLPGTGPQSATVLVPTLPGPGSRRWHEGAR
jgi:hypothetical protein